MKVTILNTSILTTHGNFKYEEITIDQAKAIVISGFDSAIGHESTAQVISTLLEIDCQVNRIQYQQKPGDIALVFKLKTRAPEGKILTIEEIEDMGYEWGIITKLEQYSCWFDFPKVHPPKNGCYPITIDGNRPHSGITVEEGQYIDGVWLTEQTLIAPTATVLAWYLLPKFKGERLC